MYMSVCQRSAVPVVYVSVAQGSAALKVRVRRWWQGRDSWLVVVWMVQLSLAAVLLADDDGSGPAR